MKYFTLLVYVLLLCGCGAKYIYECTEPESGKHVVISTSSLRDVEEGVEIAISDCGSEVTITSGPLDNGHAEVATIAKAMVPLAKAAAKAGGLP